MVFKKNDYWIMNARSYAKGKMPSEGYVVMFGNKVKSSFMKTKADANKFIRNKTK